MSDLVDMSDIGNHVELLDRAHEAADELINFEDTSSAVGKSPFLTAADTQAIIGGARLVLQHLQVLLSQNPQPS